MNQKTQNRAQRRRANRHHVKRATAFALAGLMATSGISLPAGTFAYGAENTPCLHLQAQKAVEDLQPADADMMCMSLQHWRITEKVKHR